MRGVGREARRAGGRERKEGKGRKEGGGIEDGEGEESGRERHLPRKIIESDSPHKPHLVRCLTPIPGSHFQSLRCQSELQAQGQANNTPFHHVTLTTH